MSPSESNDFHSGVKEACSEFLEKQLDPANCLGIHMFAENHGCESLRAASSLYTHKHFEDVVQNEEFRTLAAKDVQKLIASDEIQVGTSSVGFSRNVLHYCT